MKKKAVKKTAKKKAAKAPVSKYTGYIQIPLGALISMNTNTHHEQVANVANGDSVDLYKVRATVCTIVFDMTKCPVTIGE